MKAIAAAPAAVVPSGFADEVAKRRPKASTALSAGARQALTRSHRAHATPMQLRAKEALGLERRCA